MGGRLAALAVPSFVCDSIGNVRRKSRMNLQSFQHRSGRVISLGRLVLGSVFLAAIWLDPTQPSRYATEAYAILSCYLAAAAFHLLATWRNWWLETKLALPAHLTDMSMFAAMVYLTEGYTSPFFTFFVFILLSAAVRWSWRGTALTAGAIILLFFGAGLAALNWGTGEYELPRVIFRSTYLLVLSLVLIWFAVNQKSREPGGTAPVDLIDPDRPGDPPIERAMRFAARRLEAGRLLFVWWDKEEPWLGIAKLDADGFRQEKNLPPREAPLVASISPQQPFLFDTDRRRALTPSTGSCRTLSGVDAIDPEFAARYRVEEGIAIPIESDLAEGTLLALEIPGLCADDLDIARELGSEISAALERSSVIGLLEENTATQTRLSLTRDIHDSLIQVLAGTAFRLEGMRKAARSGKGIDADIDSLQEELEAEQRELRLLIDRLRQPVPVRGSTFLGKDLPTLAERLSRQWGILCRVESAPVEVRVDDRIGHAVRQLIREAVANAVRHGGASEVSLLADSADGMLSLQITDNGSGFPEAPDGEVVLRPWSLQERVDELGGTIALNSRPQGSTVRISIPVGSPG